MKAGDLITDRNGVNYTLIEAAGRGGQAKVWKVCEENSKKLYAFKYYRRDPKNVRGNIEDLIKIGVIKDRNGNALDSVVMPLSLVDGSGNAFGYIMNLVDLKDYVTLKKAWDVNGKYPTPFAICNIVKNFALFFERLHLGHGFCYKDVNEGNIFFKPKTGEIKIIDNDNIGLASKKVIKGTPCYMAPEVVLGKAPNADSDKFSFAVFLYRLLTGGYPFEGPYTADYCLKNDILINDPKAIEELFGKNPVFVWHPTDKRNCIKKYNGPKHQAQAACWERLPQELKDLFIKTFVTNLPESQAVNRTTDVAWQNLFATFEKNLVTCPHCKEKTFAVLDKCFECEKPLPKKQPAVTFTVLSMGESRKQISLPAGTKVRGEKISKNLPSGDLLQIVYNANAKKLGAKNLTKSSWTVATANGVQTPCNSNKIIPLEVGMKIALIPKMAQLNVAALT